ncbi:MAG TPA: SGNH/GDSL hydrolase family protein [Marmoricola sp.]|jgi:lysophospholipase L1-like esterase|nr:SGNH/GDSL hydrolase family protein [Marmoricola sp.]
MKKAPAPNRFASAAAYGGGGLSVLGGSLYALLRAEAKLARRAIGNADNRVPDATGWYGRGRPGPAIKIALLGDSSAAGYGVDSVEETPGARLGAGVAAAGNRRVHVREFAVVGAQTSDLDAQIDLALPTGPDIAVVLIGANDVTHTVRPATSVRLLAAAVRRLREAGVAVVVGTCPDLGTVRPIPQPLRQIAKAWSRKLAAAQMVVVVEEGGRAVSLGSILGPEFDAAPAILFGPDRFHPSAAGYASLAAVLVPSVLASLGLAPDDEVHPEALRGEGILPVRSAAAHATRHPGTEVGGTELGAESRDGRGRWAMLMRRRRHAPTDDEAPQENEDAEDAAAVE